jgi:hypothetical protein
VSGGCDRTAAGLSLPPHAHDGAGGYRAFEAGVWPGEAAPAMLELRLKTGASFALGYAWLARAEFEPGDVITLRFSDTFVTLSGQNLRPVYEAVVGHRARWVWEADRPIGMLADGTAPVVASILSGPAPGSDIRVSVR